MGERDHNLQRERQGLEKMKEGLKKQVSNLEEEIIDVKGNIIIVEGELFLNRFREGGVMDSILIAAQQSLVRPDIPNLTYQDIMEKCQAKGDNQMSFRGKYPGTELKFWEWYDEFEISGIIKESRMRRHMYAVIYCQDLISDMIAGTTEKKETLTTLLDKATAAQRLTRGRTVRLSHHTPCPIRWLTRVLLALQKILPGGDGNSDDVRTEVESEAKPGHDDN
jgi:hypothetical protein